MIDGGSRFTREQLEYAEVVRDFVQRHAGTAEQRDRLTDGGRERHSPWLHRAFAEAGLLGVSIPEEYGGCGGGMVELCLMFEEIFRGLAPLHGAGTSHTVAGIYHRYGSQQQKRDALGAICRGEVMSISISEPEAGSDAANISCRGTAGDGGFVINGQKTWCSDAQFATRILLVARTARGESRHHGLTMFDVPADADGLTIRPISTMGGNEVNDLFFTDVFVPASAVVGELDGGWNQLMAGLNAERLVCAAQSIGTAERAFSDLLSYVKQRKQFGQSIGSFQAVRHRIADLAIDIEAARSLTYDTVMRAERAGAKDVEVMRRTSMAKVKATETAKRMALEGVQLMGGYGYATEFGMEAHLRTAIAPTIFAGTNEIQREIISGSLGLR